MAGLASFLIAHLFYISLFIWIKRMNQRDRRWDPKIIFITLIYTGGLFYFLYPNLGPLQLPVAVYAIVLGVMFITAFHAFSIRQQLAGFFCACGALLFVVSDSLLAINKFCVSFLMADVLIMFTYAIAQLFIVTGASSYLRRYSLL